MSGTLHRDEARLAGWQTGERKDRPERQEQESFHAGSPFSRRYSRR